MTTQSKFFLVAIAAYALIASIPSWAEARPAELSVKTLQLARGVEGRQPVEPNTEFSADGERVYAYVCLANSGATTQVRVIWQRGEKVFHRTTLKVGHAKSWRSWAYIRAMPHLVGEWQVLVQSLEGDELARKRFVIER
ncbi:MAG: DUF2914 domain-containing protein [Deltaproteobacteria bacterium]|nr:DUF2914 domain-containing protein [Deltaproteobacteria bacterium]